MNEILSEKNFKKYAFWVIVLILVFLSYLILKPYLIALISAFILAYLTKPLYTLLLSRMGKIFSALVCILVVVLVIVLPFAIVVGGTIQQASSILGENKFDGFLKSVVEHPIVRNLGIYFETSQLNNWSKEIVSFLISLLKPLISKAVSFVVILFVMFFGMYAFLVNWDFLAGELKEFIPFKNKEKISKEISEATKNIVYGTLLVGLIEFAVATLSFYFLGVDSFLVLSSIIFFSAFIPGIGPGAVWVPLAIYYFFVSNNSAAVGVIIAGLIISFGIDTFLRGKILAKTAKINPFVLLLGILGGVSVFGLFGFIIGPLILVYTIKLLKEGMKGYL